MIREAGQWATEAFWMLVERFDAFLFDLDGVEGPLPGTGAIVEALRVTTSVEPMIVGKPSAAMFDIALSDLHAGRDRTAMVGDSLESDIAGAHRAGIAGVLIAREDSQPAFTQAPPALEAIIRDLGGLFDPPAHSVRGSRSAARNAIGGKL